MTAEVLFHPHGVPNRTPCFFAGANAAFVRSEIWDRFKSAAGERYIPRTPHRKTARRRNQNFHQILARLEYLRASRYRFCSIRYNEMR